MSLRVLHTGLASRVVDFGRPRTRSLGVPVGGAADRRSLALGNALVGNEPDAAALEITLTGPRLRAEADLACVVFGAPFTLSGIARPLRVGTTFTLQAGEELHVGGTPRGARAYLCVHGGLQVPRILGSCSGLDDVRRDDLLPCRPGRIGGRFVPAAEPSFPEVRVLRVLPGLQADWFDVPAFHEQVYTVGSASNRMGLRLRGQPLVVPERELVSEPVAPGAVQVTRDGQSIVLGVDGQTIGGYPKIAHVIGADLDHLGQLRPGDRVRFAPVTLAEAVAFDRAAAAELATWVLRVRVSLDDPAGACKLHDI